MTNRLPIRLQRATAFPGGTRVGAICRRALFLLLTAGAAAQIPAQTAEPAGPVILDHVVAVVNNQAILASDIDDEIRLSVLDPGRGGLGVLTRVNALDQLIGRDLIQQQIRQEDLESSAPAQAEVDVRLAQIRKELPACVRHNCASDEGWNRFLAAHGLTVERVETYLRYRLEILRFIELRFRQGIDILPEEIAAYYHDTLLPQYAKGEAIPALDQVSARIEEILLQQRVNRLFDDWLSNLRKQGEVEVLDPTLESPAVAPAPALAGTTDAGSGPIIATGGGKKGSQ
jgi:peptidyl-prolyl cis-trans isomerase SurA